MVKKIEDYSFWQNNTRTRQTDGLDSTHTERHRIYGIGHAMHSIARQKAIWIAQRRPTRPITLAKNESCCKLAHVVHLVGPKGRNDQLFGWALHWLPIESRIKFKLCVLIHRVSRGTAPLYLCELCKPCTDSRLRSKSRGDFITRRTRLRFTDRAFAVSAPSAWNSLPIDIRDCDCSSEATFKETS